MKVVRLLASFVAAVASTADPASAQSATSRYELGVPDAGGRTGVDEHGDGRGRTPEGRAAVHRIRG
jgi:hypothetical protein